MPTLSTALCLSQLLSTVSEKGGSPAAYREQTGQTRDTVPPLIHSSTLQQRVMTIIFLVCVFLIFPASLARHFLSQSWVTANGERERGNKFNEALHTLLRCVCTSQTHHLLTHLSNPLLCIAVISVNCCLTLNPT